MNNKIAVVSDIHANKYALNKFLEYVNKEKIDIILNLGDFVQIGPNPLEVSEIILGDSRFISILGNNETSLFEISYNDTSSENNHKIWTKNQINNFFDDILNIPQERIVKIKDISILMIHSRKDDNKEMPLIYTKPINDFSDDYKDYNADIVLFGHSHEKLYIEHNNKLFINPGSLGCSKIGRVDFAILEINQNTLENCIFKSLEYDNLKIFEDYENNNVPDKNFLIETFHQKK